MSMSLWIKKLATDERGNMLMMGAASMPLLIGAAAMAVDGIHLTLARRQLQRAADSAALAGAHARVQSASVDTAARSDLDLNNRITLSVPAQVENAPTSGPFSGNLRAVRVSLTATRPMPFISFFTSSTPTIRVQATAASVFTGEFCMVSLENGTSTGIIFTGSSSVNLGCGVATNSRSSTAVIAAGNARVVASPVAAIGGVPPSAGYQQGTTLLPYSPSQADPYVNLPTPSPTNCQGPANVQPNQTATLSPGCYRGMDLKGNVTLQPGTYFIDGSQLEFGATSNVRGSGVTFVLTSSTAGSNPSSIATLSMHGNAVLNLTSPDTGTYEGILFYQDRRSNAGTATLVNGNSASSFEGGFYFPRGDITFNGNTGLRTECLQLVARRITFSGDSRVENNCSTNGGAQAFDANLVRLVG
jgi:Flp pilus assembly protein TadG